VQITRRFDTITVLHSSIIIKQDISIIGPATTFTNDVQKAVARMYEISETVGDAISCLTTNGYDEVSPGKPPGCLEISVNTEFKGGDLSLLKTYVWPDDIMVVYQKPEAEIP
jgi:hypothetical protein